MNDDQDWDQLLQRLREEEPSVSRVDKWQKAVAHEIRKPQTFNRGVPRRWLELAAAVLVGVIVGGAVFSHQGPRVIAEDDLANIATLELVVTNSP